MKRIVDSIDQNREMFAKICREISYFRNFVFAHLNLYHSLRKLYKLHSFDTRRPLHATLKKKMVFLRSPSLSFSTSSHSPREISNRRNDSNFLISPRLLPFSTIRSIDLQF